MKVCLYNDFPFDFLSSNERELSKFSLGLLNLSFKLPLVF